MTSATAEHETHDESPLEGTVSNKPSYDDVNTPVIILVGLISAVATLLTIFFVQGLCYHWQKNFENRRAEEFKMVSQTEQIDSQKSMLNGGDGLVSIEDAMKKVVDQYGKK